MGALILNTVLEGIGLGTLLVLVCAAGHPEGRSRDGTSL